MTMFPFAVDDLERDILVRWAGREDDRGNFRLFLVLDDAVRRGLLRVDEIRVEDAGRVKKGGRGGGEGDE